MGIESILSTLSRQQFLRGSLAVAGAIAGAGMGVGGAPVTFAGPFRQVRNRVQEFRFVHGGGASTVNLSTLDYIATGADLGILAGANHLAGLMHNRPDQQTLPNLADNVTISDDGLTYTFTLHPGLRWSDGSRFTAQDIKYSWERNCSPDVKAQSVSLMLIDIAGVAEVIRGDAKEIFGVQVPDDNTLLITLSSPNFAFPAKMGASWSWGWVKRDVYEANPDGYFVGQGGRPLSNGPFKLDQWVQDDRLIFSRNPYYHGEPASLDSLHLLFNRDISSLLVAYENNELDMVQIDAEDVERFDAPGRPHSGELRRALYGVDYIGFKEALPPMEDPLIRLALYQAIDRETIAKQIFRNTMVAATSIHAPDFPWYDPEPVLPPFDPAAARDLLGRSSYKSAKNLPPIRIAGSTFGLLQRVAVALQQMWQDNLGVQVDIKLTEFPYEAATAKRQMSLGDRGFLWPDVGYMPSSLWDPDGAVNHILSGTTREDGTFYGWHQNDEIKRLLIQADTNADPTQRTQTYRQVERMAIRDVYQMPLFHRYAYVLVKPWVMDYLPNLAFFETYGIAPSNVWIAEHR